ncbi:MAG: serine/threonine protein kinase [Deltaproteobacteria bacterium]|nr:serine/threonine protein kinase [Deltaproteobacteria bacterium]
MTQEKIKTLGRYELREEIGRGGMATVYRGYDSTLKREVAVKVLHPHLITHEEARARFEREARSVARLHHPSIVEIYDYSEAETGEAFIVMELVEGFTLRDFLNQHPNHALMAEGAALVARQIFIALHIAHAEGIIHRDVKPENILIGKEGKIQLSDFGIAFLAGIGQMTATGQILGSPTYMSPEHIESPSVDVRADIFSVGTILYEMVVGQPPFVGNNPHQIIKRVVEGYYDHPLSVNPSIGHPVSSVIVKCLQQQPERRYASASEAIAELDEILLQMGIEDSDKQQKAYVQKPVEWEEAHLADVVARTLKMGKDAQKSKQLPEAMNHLNRVLAIEPSNDTALYAVNVLSRRRRFRRNIERVGGAAAVAFAILAIVAGIILYRYSYPAQNTSSVQPLDLGDNLSTVGDSASIGSKDFSDSTESDKTGDIAGADTSGETDKTSLSNGGDTVNDTATDAATEKKVIIVERDSDMPDNSPRVIIADTSATNGNDHKRKIRLPQPEMAVERQVVFNPIPMSVEIVIDETQKFVFKATDRSRNLTVGTHTIQFVPLDDRLEPSTQTIVVTPSETPLTVPARLKWKPATLIVRSNVAADVAINGRFKGQTNEPIELDIRKGPSSQFRILLSARGYHPIEKLVSVSAGKTTETVVQLEKEQH